MAKGQATSGKVGKNGIVHIPNPTGKGGFKERPEDINRNGFAHGMQRIDTWLKKFKDMTRGEFRQYLETRQEDDMYEAEIQALKQIEALAKVDYADLKRLQFITERTEGKPAVSIDHTSKGERLQGAIIGFEDEPEPED